MQIVKLNQLFQVAEEHGIVSKLGKLIEKNENSIHKPYKTMKIFQRNSFKMQGYIILNLRRQKPILVQKIHMKRQK